MVLLYELFMNNKSFVCVIHVFVFRESLHYIKIHSDKIMGSILVSFVSHASLVLMLTKLLHQSD